MKEIRKKFLSFVCVKRGKFNELFKKIQ